MTHQRRHVLDPGRLPLGHGNRLADFLEVVELPAAIAGHRQCGGVTKRGQAAAPVTTWLQFHVRSLVHYDVFTAAALQI